MQHIVDLLKEKANMLRDYFSLDIREVRVSLAVSYLQCGRCLCVCLRCSGWPHPLPTNALGVILP